MTNKTTKLNRANLAWIYLIFAGLSEVAWAVGIKMTNGFTHLEWSLFTIAFMIVSFFALAKALISIPLGTCYAIFTGTGTAGAAIVGIIYLEESASALKIISLVVLLIGIVGLRFVDGEIKEDEENHQIQERSDEE